MPISLNPNIKPVAKVYNNDQDFIELPFPYLRLSWNNGNAHASKNEGAKYFGGFQRGENDIQEDLAKLQFDNLPNYFTPPTEWISEKGATYQARSTRFLYAAPISAKDDWWKDKQTQKRRHRLDFLVYLASVEKEVVVPWGPAVISAKQYSASGIIDAFQGWGKDTRSARHEFAGDLDEMFFYHCVGTFGNERVIQKVGESIIITCQFNKPSTWTEKMLEKMFVGESIAAVMVDLQGQAQEWTANTRQSLQEAGNEVPADGENDVEFAAPENFVDPYQPTF